MPGWEEPLTPEDVYDLPKSTGMLAEQKPWWEPGTASGYHSVTMGHLVGELVQRVTGKSLKRFIDEEIAGPLGADFQLGLRDDDWERCADIVPPPDATPQPPPPAATYAGAKAAEESDGKPPPPPAAPTPIPLKVALNPSNVSALTAHTPGWRAAALGASNGHSNARALARILSVISLGGSVDSTTYLSPSTISLIFEEQVRGNDLVIGADYRFGLGYALTGRDTEVGWLPGPEAEAEGEEGDQGQGGKGICLWGGWGGSIGLVDVERGLTVAYVMNRMEGKSLASERTREYVRAVYGVLGVDV